jgi:hypothetical protein
VSLLHNQANSRRGHPLHFQLYNLLELQLYNQQFNQLLNRVSSQVLNQPVSQPDNRLGNHHVVLQTSQHPNQAGSRRHSPPGDLVLSQQRNLAGIHPLSQVVNQQFSQGNLFYKLIFLLYQKMF